MGLLDFVLFACGLISGCNFLRYSRWFVGVGWCWLFVFVSLLGLVVVCGCLYVVYVVRLRGG